MPPEWACIESRDGRKCSVVVIWTGRSWWNTRGVHDKTREGRKYAREKNLRGEKIEEGKPLFSYFSRAYHQSSATCYPALRVLSSQLSVSVMRIHVPQKTAGVSSFKLRRIPSLTWSTIQTPSVEMLDFTIRTCSTPTFLYFDFYWNTANATNVYLQLCLFYNYNVNRKRTKYYSIN